MKLHSKILIATLALTGAVLYVNAQDAGDRPPGGPGPGPGHHPPPPIIVALDANHDGVIDADEINNAPAVLRSLDKNGDGQLTPDELRPPRPEGQGQRPPPPQEN